MGAWVTAAMCKRTGKGRLGNGRCWWWMGQWRPRQMGAAAVDMPSRGWVTPRASRRAERWRWSHIGGVHSNVQVHRGGGGGVVSGVATATLAGARAMDSEQRWALVRKSGCQLSRERRRRWSRRMAAGAHLMDCLTDLKRSYILSLPVPRTKRKTRTSPSPQPNA